MGLLSQLFGKKAESAFKDMLNDAEKKIKDAVKDGFGDEGRPETASPGAPAPASPAEEERSDALWGPVMPKDENQFSFNGTYKEYFEKIFREDFPEYSFMLSHPKYYSSDIYTFSKGGSKVLVVELMQKRCEAKSLQRETLQDGLGYLRFYTDCSSIGWWNARTYVTGKIREALNR